MITTDKIEIEGSLYFDDNLNKMFMYTKKKFFKMYQIPYNRFIDRDDLIKIRKIKINKIYGK
jgi:hypothetical protein